MLSCWDLMPRTTTDHEHWECWCTDRAYAGMQDAPDWMPAGSTMGLTPACHARGRTYHRSLVMSFENNPLIYTGD